jgi:hypothetical protein
MAALVQVRLELGATLSSRSRQLRLNLHHSHLAVSTVPKAAPLPLLRQLTQSALHRVAVHISQLLDPLVLREHVEVIEPRRPEISFWYFLTFTKNKTWVPHPFPLLERVGS